MGEPQGERASAVPWPPLLLAAAIAAALALGKLYPLPWPGIDDPPARVIGYGLGLIGLLLIGWGTLALIQSGTTVAPHRPAAHLVTRGPFSFRRNPIYMGEVLLLLGLAQATGNIWMAIMAPLFAAAVLVLAILPEERHLEARFGEAYLAYKERTRRWF